MNYGEKAQLPKLPKSWRGTQKVRWKRMSILLKICVDFPIKYIKWMGAFYVHILQSTILYSFFVPTKKTKSHKIEIVFEFACFKFLKKYYVWLTHKIYQMEYRFEWFLLEHSVTWFFDRNTMLSKMPLALQMYPSDVQIKCYRKFDSKLSNLPSTDFSKLPNAFSPCTKDEFR